MFSRISGRYDRANRWMSFGSDQWVRSCAVKLSGAKPGDSVLDCAAGTGDLTIKFHDALGGQGRFVGTDFNADMLAHAETKSRDRGLAIEWQVQDAQNLDFPDESFDVVSIAYGIRNVDDPKRALAEMYRVLKPGGRLVVLEFGQPGGLMKPGYYLFNRYFIPLIGGLAGAVTMLLLAPQSGKRTRMQIRQKGFELRDQATGMMEDAMAQARLDGNKITRDGRRKAKELLHQGQDLVTGQLEHISDAAKAGKKAIQSS